MTVIFAINPCSIPVHLDSHLATHCLQAAWKEFPVLFFFLPFSGKFFSYAIIVSKNDILAESDKRGRMNRPHRKSAHIIEGWVEFLFTLIVAPIAEGNQANRKLKTRWAVCICKGADFAPSLWLVLHPLHFCRQLQISAGFATDHSNEKN